MSKSVAIRPRYLLLLAIVLFGALAPAVTTGIHPATVAAAAPTDPRYFAETGHYISGRFREFWEGRGGLLTYGLPLTSVYLQIATDGKTYQTQVFERAIFELHPENTPPYDVLLRHLGRELASSRAQDQPFQYTPREDAPDTTYFTETGHNVGPVFMSYWRANGGLQTFGYPLSERLNEVNAADGQHYLVMYFERARFEYHPELANTPFVVLLGQIAREAMDRLGVPEAARAPETTPPTATPAPLPLAPPPSYPVLPDPLPPPAPGAARSNAGFPFLKGPPVALGIQAHWYGQPHGRLLDLMSDIGFNWTKQQVVWRDIEVRKGEYHWGLLDGIVDDLQRNNVRIMLSIVKSPRWATPGGNDDGTPANADDFRDFLYQISYRYRGKAQAYELWNEENLAAETGNRIDPGFFVRLMRGGYIGAKTGDPNAIVVLGALTPTGVNDTTVAVDDTIYLDQLFRVNNGEIRNYYDVLGAHPYGMANPPDTLVSEGRKGPGDKFNEHDSFYFRRFEAHYAIMQKYGDGNKQIWLTEWGWGSDFRPDGYQEFNTVTEEMRATYVRDAILMMRQRYSYMGATFLWNLNWSILDPWYSGPAHYCIINADYSPRPVYYYLKALPK